MKKVCLEFEVGVFNDIVDCFVVTEMKRQIKYFEGELEAFATGSHYVHTDDAKVYKKDLKAFKRILAWYTE